MTDQERIIAELQRQLAEAHQFIFEAGKFAGAQSLKLTGAYNELMNLQPHIAQLPEQHRAVIDAHVDVAMELLKHGIDAALKEGPE